MLRRAGTHLPLIVVTALLLAACSGGGSAPKRDAAKTLPVEPGGPILRLVELNSWYHAALVDPKAVKNTRDLEALVRPLCDKLTVCRVGVWYDQYSMPNAMPVRTPQLEAQEYAFGRTAAGAETSLWNCNKYPEFEAEGACLPRLMN
jgi:hypothetical protein